jgi:hypothetical protein
VDLAVPGRRGGRLCLGGDHYWATTNRKLTEIRQAVQLPTGTGTVTWVVYEQIGTGSFTKIFEKAVQTAGDSTMKLQSSGTISVPLQTGRRYAIGVWGNFPAGFGTSASAADPVLRELWRVSRGCGYRGRFGSRYACDSRL